MENQITQKELAAIFPDGVPMPVMKMIFPEKSEKLTVKDIRDILNAMRNGIALSAGAEPVAHGVFNKNGDLLYLSASKEAADLIKKWEGDSIKPLYAAPPAPDVDFTQGWQPIETAPVNGPNFIAWVIDLIDEYDEDDRLIQRGKRVGSAVVAQCVSFTGGRGEVVEVPWKFVTGRQYTHWMPLPASPCSNKGVAE